MNGWRAFVTAGAVIAVTIACARASSGVSWTPIFSWDTLAACAADRGASEVSHDEVLEFPRVRVRLSVPSTWMKDQALLAESHRDSYSWADTLAGEWLAVDILPLHASSPPRGAAFYLTDRFLDARGDTVIAMCPHCLHIRLRCQAAIGGRQALLTEGTYGPRTSVVTALWPVASGRWLAVQAGGADSTVLPKLHARVRQIWFE
jgi:hypothetical protein